MSESPPGSGFAGAQDPFSANGKFNTMASLIEGIVNRIATITVARVVAVTTTGADVAVGFVDIQPMVNQLDGAGNATPHAVVHNLPYIRLQGGANAIILDPQVGDIGLVAFCFNDISAVKTSKAQSNPGSGRRFDWADGIYLGGILNGVPTQYVEFSAAGIKINSPALVSLVAPDVQINAQTVEIVASTSLMVTSPTVALTASATFTVTSPMIDLNGNVATVGTLTNNAVDVGSPHTHGNVMTGGSRTSGPA